MTVIKKLKLSITYVLVVVVLCSAFSLPLYAQTDSDSYTGSENNAQKMENGFDAISTSTEGKNIPEDLGEPINNGRAATAITSGVYAISNYNTTYYARSNTTGGRNLYVSAILFLPAGKCIESLFHVQNHIPFGDG